MTDHDAAARIAALEAQLAALRNETPTLTFGQVVANRLPTLKGNSRDTYETHLNRLLDGVSDMCDQLCEPCLVDPDGPCRCDCAKCVKSRVSVIAHRDLPAVASTCTKDQARNLMIVAGRIARRRGLVQNRRRAARGLADKAVGGTGAEETALTAVRWLYRDIAGKDHPAMELGKPKRPLNQRRALADFELLELVEITGSGGDDPELDSLILDLGIEAGCRRDGAVRLTMGAIAPHEQTLLIREKGGVEEKAPVSAELVTRLLSHAASRGGAACRPGPGYRSDAPVLYFKSGSSLTERRFDTLKNRWQLGLDWGNELGVTYHFIRHTMSEILKSTYGIHYAKRYLRHRDETITDTYGRATLEQLAAAMSALLGYEHPLATGRASRREQTFRRFGIDLGEAS